MPRACVEHVIIATIEKGIEKNWRPKVAAITTSIEEKGKPISGITVKYIDRR